MSDDRPRLDRLTPAQRAELARKLAAAQQRPKRRAAPPLIASERGEQAVLSYAQQRMWFLQQLDPGSNAYNMPYAARIRGPLDAAALCGAFDDLVRRHDALRTVFPAVRGEPYQRILQGGRWVLPVEDASNLEATVREEADRCFDLAAGPLFRTRLLRAGDDDHTLLVSMHHIVSDGWSMGVLWRDLTALYTARVRGVPVALPPLAVQYADYATWQRAWLAGDELERQLAYWKQALAHVPEQLALPAKGPRPKVKTFSGAKVAIAIEADIAGRVRALARRAGTTLFISMLAAFRALLARYTGQPDVAIGTPIANRNRTEIEGLIGLFVNTLALRTAVRDDDSFTTLLAREKATALAAYDHMETPFEMVVESLQLERRLDRTPLFQVSYAHEDLAEAQIELAGLAVEYVDIDALAAKFDLMAFSFDEADAMRLTLIYNVDLFDRAGIEQLGRHFVRLLDQVTRNPEQPLARVDILDRDERERLRAWNETAAPARTDRCIHELVEEQARRVPAAIAVVQGDVTVTYGELDARANRLAQRLIALGVRPDARVAVCLERRPHMVVALLGILKAGGAYVPLDPKYPRARLRELVEDARPVAIVTDAVGRAALKTAFEAIPHIAIDEPDRGEPVAAPQVAGLTPSHLAYVIYTSGSTGTPKGVMVEHRSFVNHLDWQVGRFGFSSSDVVLQRTSISFDASVWEIWTPLALGARLVLLPPEAEREPEAIAATIDTHGVTIVQFVPSLLRMLMNAPGARPFTCDYVFSGGERLDPDLASWAARRARRALVNLYGPTEATIDSLAWPYVEREASVRIPIGRPIANTRIYLLDAHRQPVPIGVAGELYIAGAPLARGYLDRSTLTAERFVVDPFSSEPGARMYRTGDLARYLPDGNVEFLGRNDDQVKISGYRIELGEIEAHLAAYETVRDAAVAARAGSDGEPRLVAYVTAERPIQAAELRDHLARLLPAHMVPAAFVQLDALPLTPSGKVERKALPAPSGEAYVRSAYVPPTTPTEQMIAKIWSQLLGLDRVGIHDDFFALGGNSLRVIRLIAEIEVACGVRVAVRAVFERPTIAALAAHVASSAPGTSERIVYTRTGVTAERAMVTQEYFYYLDRDDHDPDSYFVNVAFVIEGDLDVKRLVQCYAGAVASQAIHRTGFREVGGLLQQVVFPLAEATPTALEVADRSPLVREAWQAELDHATAELKALDYDLAAGRGLIHGRLIRLTDTEHALVLVAHHIAVDGGAITALRKQIFDGYAGVVPAEPALQYIDFSHAQETRAHTPAGATQAEQWAAMLRDAPPTVLEGDFPRAPIDARRDAASLGITADLSYPPEVVTLPAATYATAVAAARAARTSPFVVFMSALAWLLHERSGQTDVTIQTTYSPRAQDAVLDPVQGPLTTWTVFRIDLGPSPSLADTIRRTAPVVERVHENGPPHDFYRQVPHGLRRVVLNYIPVGASPPPAPQGGILVKPHGRPFPPWKRPWDLHCTMIDDSTSARLFWTGFSKLFRRETVVALLERYIAILDRAT